MKVLSSLFEAPSRVRVVEVVSRAASSSSWCSVVYLTKAVRRPRGRVHRPGSTADIAAEREAPADAAARRARLSGAAAAAWSACAVTYLALQPGRRPSARPGLPAWSRSPMRRRRPTRRRRARPGARPMSLDRPPGPRAHRHFAQAVRWLGESGLAGRARLRALQGRRPRRRRHPPAHLLHAGHLRPGLHRPGGGGRPRRPVLQGRWLSSSAPVPAESPRRPDRPPGPAAGRSTSPTSASISTPAEVWDVGPRPAAASCAVLPKLSAERLDKALTSNRREYLIGGPDARRSAPHAHDLGLPGVMFEEEGAARLSAGPLRRPPDRFPDHWRPRPGRRRARLRRADPRRRAGPCPVPLSLDLRVQAALGGRTAQGHGRRSRPVGAVGLVTDVRTGGDCWAWRPLAGLRSQQAGRGRPQRPGRTGRRPRCTRWARPSRSSPSPSGSTPASPTSTRPSTPACRSRSAAGPIHDYPRREQGAVARGRVPPLLQHRHRQAGAGGIGPAKLTRYFARPRPDRSRPRSSWRNPPRPITPRELEPGHRRLGLLRPRHLGHRRSPSRPPPARS